MAAIVEVFAHARLERRPYPYEVLDQDATSWSLHGFFVCSWQPTHWDVYPGTHASPHVSVTGARELNGSARSARKIIT